jgi:hypothetical protein
MSSASTQAALAKMYKTVYMNRDLANQAKRKTPAYDSVRKFDDFDGANLTFPFNDSLPAGVGTTLAGAQALATSSSFDNWVMSTRKKLYGVLTIDAESMRAARKDIGAFLRLRQKETNELMSYMKMLLGGHAFWGDGAGNIAKVVAVASSDPVTSFTIAQSDAIKIHRKQILVFNPTRTGTAGNIRASTYRVTGVNRNTSGLGTTATVTVTRVTGTTGSDPAPDDYVYMKDTYDAFPLGVSAFIPGSDPGVNGVPAALLGMTRTDDPVMKAGWRVTWQGSIEETIKFLCALMGQYVDNESTVCWVSHYNWFRLEQELTAQNRKVIDARATQVFGSPALLILTPDGNIPVVRDPYLENDVFYVLDMSEIEVHHLDPVLHIADDDGLGAIRQTADDGIEIRMRHWGENIIQRPFKCGRGEIV